MDLPALDWQPLVGAAATLLSFWAFPYLMALTWLVLLFGRATWIRWLEAAGWHGIVEAISRAANGFRSQSDVPVTIVQSRPQLERTAIENQPLGIRDTTVEGAVVPGRGHGDSSN